MAGGLHDCRVRHGVSAHEQRNAYDAFVADARAFGRGAGPRHVVQGDDRGGGKDGVLQLLAGLVDPFAEQHGDQLQMCGQCLHVRTGQCGEKMILARAVER